MLLSQNQPRVAVGLLIVKDGKELLGKRRTEHGRGEYAGVGGHVEHLETLEAAALREVSEEAGADLKLKNLRLLAVNNMRAYAPKHFVVVSFVAEWQSGEAQVTDEYESWAWYDIDKLPAPLYKATATDIEAYQTGTIYFGN